MKILLLITCLFAAGCASSQKETVTIPMNADGSFEIVQKVEK